MLNTRKVFGFATSFICVAAVIAASSCYHANKIEYPTGPTKSYKIQVVAGNNQSGPIGTQLPAPLKVYVTDDAGLKQVGVVVKFTVTEGYADLSATSVATDVDGFCEVNLTPVDYAGNIKVEAEVQYTTTSVTFTETGTESN